MRRGVAETKDREASYIYEPLWTRDACVDGMVDGSCAVLVVASRVVCRAQPLPIAAIPSLLL
jgi:hypothetical protein